MNSAAVSIRDLPRQDLPAAIDLTVRAMSNNPLHIAVLGSNRRRRDRVLHSLFTVLLADGRDVVGAYRGRELVGVLAFTRETGCLPSWRKWPRFLPAVLRAGWRAPRLGRWLTAWARRDPKANHSHLGPVAVEPTVQGEGIGTALVRHYVAHVTQFRATGYLETDSAANAHFYSRCGFRTASTARVLGVTNWFMKINARQEFEPRG